MNLGDILQFTGGLAVRVYSFYRLDWFLKELLLSNHGEFIQFTIVSVARLILAPKLVSRAAPNPTLERAMQARAGWQQRQRQAVPTVQRDIRGIPPLPPRR
jgi:hypothetical protein